MVIVIVAFACIMGHNYSLFLRGRGGKGVATGAGAALALMPIPMAIVVVVFVVLVFTVRIVSVASIVATILYPTMAVVFWKPLPYIIGACVIAAVVLWAHRRNFRRLWKRQEPRVKFPWNRRQVPIRNREHPRRPAPDESAGPRYTGVRVGTWRSLVAHPAGGRKVAGSNPAVPTLRAKACLGGLFLLTVLCTLAA